MDKGKYIDKGNDIERRVGLHQIRKPKQWPLPWTRPKEAHGPLVAAIF
jgi:hypothetical protein